MVFPKQLRRGDTILLIAPSSPLRGIDVHDCAAGLQRLGYRVRIAPSTQSSTERGYAAASAELRAEDIHSGFRDPSVDAIWAVRGGSMAAELLPLLDYELIARNPKPLLGFSDVTALHMALQERCGMVSFHCPCASSFSGDGPDPYALEQWQRVMAMEQTLTFENPADVPIRVLNPGSAGGTLVGGNLSLVVSLLGTPYALNTKGRILFLEDVDEDVYRLNRMMITLKLSGVLDDAAGILLGDFTDCRNGYNAQYTAERLMSELFGSCGKPVYSGLSVGHIRKNATLPLGAGCRMKDGRIEFCRSLEERI